MALKKYDSRGEFEDPVMRCHRCATILLKTEIERLGMCHKCGSKKMTNVLVMSEEERQQLIKWEIDPAFLEVFEGVADAR
jgi:rRNA maturation endonuclease Nob1